MFSLMLAACGRQVTGLNGSGTTNSIPSGQMLIRFRTLAPLDLTANRYVIVFNTIGNGQQPYANGFITGLTNYSFTFVVGATGGVAQFPLLNEYYFPPGSQQAQSFSVPINSQQVQFNPNSNGSGTEFTLTFQRTALLCAPVPNPAASPSATPSATPTPAPTGTGATPAPSPTPACATLGGRSSTWNINFITTDANSLPIDALGASGKDDVSFQLQVDTTTSFDKQIQRATQLQINPQSAQIAGGEIINSP